MTSATPHLEALDRLGARASLGPYSGFFNVAGTWEAQTYATQHRVAVLTELYAVEIAHAALEEARRPTCS